MERGESIGKGVALVSGAAGGLGRGICAELANHGWAVIGGYFKTEPTHHFACEWVRLDVTARPSVEAAFAAIVQRGGRLDLLVNNAGICVSEHFWQILEKDWDRMIATHLKGAFLCSQAAAKLMRYSGGHIINIGSFAGRAGARGQASYASAKAGLLGFGSSLAAELAEFDIRVNTILPGVLPTAMTSGLKVAQLDALRSANLLGRLNGVGEVAEFVRFLAGTQNISGQVFQLDSRVTPWS